MGLLFISCWGTFAQPRPYVALRVGVNQARHQFGPKLTQDNPALGNYVLFDRIGSGQAKKIQITSELALGLSVPVSSGVITDLEVTYDPRKYDSRKTLNFIGFFGNRAPAPGFYEDGQVEESITSSKSIGIKVNLRFKINECHEVFGRLGIQRTKLIYHSNFYQNGALLRVGSTKKNFVQHSTEIGWLYHWSKAISSEASVGYHFGKVKKISDIHPEPDIDYFPKLHLRQWSVNYGIRYTF